MPQVKVTGFTILLNWKFLMQQPINQVYVGQKIGVPGQYLDYFPGYKAI